MAKERRRVSEAFASVGSVHGPKWLSPKEENHNGVYKGGSRAIFWGTW